MIEQTYASWENAHKVSLLIGLQGFNWMRVATLLAPSNLVLQSSLDTLSLIQLGSLRGDRHLLNEGTVRYGRTLRRAGNALRQGDVRDDTVLASVSILALCELFDHIKESASGWLGHVAGIDQILLARGPESLRSKLSTIIFFTSRHASLSRSLVCRKADPLDTPVWRAAVRRVPLGFASHWISLAMQIPAYLEALDGIDPKALNTLQSVQNLLSDAETLESEISEWHSGWQNIIGATGRPPYTVHSIEEFQPFASVIQDRTLQTAYRFPDYKSSHLHGQYWSGLWHLRRTIQSLRNLQTNILSDGINPGTEDPAELDNIIFHICHCMPGYASPSAGTQGQIALLLPLRVVIIHFRSRQMLDWKAWTEDLRANIFTRGLSQPNITDEPVAIPRLSPPKSSGGLKADVSLA
jgi:hypothetical protein